MTTLFISKIKSSKDLSKLKEKSLHLVIKEALDINKTKRDIEEFVDYIHGSNECGLDFAFSKRDNFGLVKIYGMQVKAVDIKLTRKRNISINVKELIAQALMAYSRDLKDVGLGKYPQIDGLYIVTNKIISPDAKIWINTTAKYLKNLHYLEKDSLYDFIDDLRGQASSI